MASTDTNTLATEIAVVEGLRGLAGQEATVEQLRVRAARLVTVGVAVAAALGFQVDARAMLSTTIFLAAFAVLLAAIMWIKWPREWAFHLSPEILLSDEWLPEGEDEGSYRHSYACELDRLHTENEKVIRRAFRAYRAGLVALGAETAVLVLTI